MKLSEIIATFVGITPTDNPFGILAEFKNPGHLAKAAEGIRDAGYRRFDVHSPFPIHGMNKAMGLGPSLLPWIVLGGGATGFVVGLGLQIWIHAIEYPLVISGKPFLSIPAFIPVTFEMTVLFAAFAAVFGMLLLNFLPMLYHPLHKVRRFNRATSDGFFLSVEARDPIFDADQTRDLLASLGGENITLLDP